MSQPTDKLRTDFTEGSITGSILKMGLPSLMGFLAQHIYAMTDMFWVSRLPAAESAVAAITFFTNLMWVLFAFNSLIGPGSVAIISRRYGEKAYELTEKAIKETLILKLFFGALLGVVGLVLLPEMLGLLGAEGDALQLGVGYGRILLYGLPIAYATYSIFTALRGIANPNLAMGMMIGSNLLNLVLDPLFIFGYLGMPAMGINGASFASVLSFSITFIVGIALFHTDHTNVGLKLVGKAPVTIASMVKILKLGIPAWLGELSFSTSRMLITPIVASFGTAVVAAYGVSIQLFGFGIMMLVGLGLGLSSLIGHNLGARKVERAKITADRAIILGVGLMAVLGVLTFVFGRQFMGLFFSSSETVEYGVEILRIWALGFPFFGAFVMIEQVHMGVGHNTPPMIVSMVHSWGLQVLPAVVVTQVLGYTQVAVWWVLAVSGVISTIGFYWYYRRGAWLRFQV